MQILFGSLLERIDTIRETDFVQTPTQDIEYIWTRMFDHETTQMRREQLSVMRGEVYFQNRGRGGFVRRRGRVAAHSGSGSGDGNGGRGYILRVKNVSGVENQTIGAVSVRKKTACAHGVVMQDTSRGSVTTKQTLGGKADGGRGRGKSGRGRGGGYSKFGEGETKEKENEQGDLEVLIGEVNMGIGDGDRV